MISRNLISRFSNSNFGFQYEAKLFWKKRRFDLFYLSSKEILSINLVNRNKPLEVFVKLSENPLNATQFSHLDQGRLEESRTRPLRNRILGKLAAKVIEVIVSGKFHKNTNFCLNCVLSKWMDWKWLFVLRLEKCFEKTIFVDFEGTIFKSLMKINCRLSKLSKTFMLADFK